MTTLHELKYFAWPPLPFPLFFLGCPPVLSRFLGVTPPNPTSPPYLVKNERSLMSCVICLVIAREIFLVQSDCSAITEVHNFSLLSLTCFVKDKQTLKTGNTWYKLDIFRHRPIYGLFPFKWLSVFTADFSTNHSRFVIGETSSPLLLLVWVARTKLNSKKI